MKVERENREKKRWLKDKENAKKEKGRI